MTDPHALPEPQGPRLSLRRIRRAAGTRRDTDAGYTAAVRVRFTPEERALLARVAAELGVPPAYALATLALEAARVMLADK